MWALKELLWPTIIGLFSVRILFFEVFERIFVWLSSIPSLRSDSFNARTLQYNICARTFFPTF